MADEAAAAQPVAAAWAEHIKRRGSGRIAGVTLFHMGLSPAVTPSTAVNGDCHSAGAPSGFNWSAEKTNTKQLRGSWRAGIKAHMCRRH